MNLQGKHIFLRTLEPEDLDFIYTIENDESVWEVSHTQTPYSRFLIRQYLKNAHQDIYEAKQLRLVICLQKNTDAVGLIDLFDFNPQHNRAGIGILIHQPENRSKGIGSEALELILNYAFMSLQLHQLYANISSDNLISLQLFTKFGFRQIGTKKQWNKINNIYKDEILLQLINLKN